MQQEIELNIIPLKALVQEAEFAFFRAKQDGYCPIHVNDLKGDIEGLVNESEMHYENWLNNTRYEETCAPTDKENHFALNISFFSENRKLLDHPALINEQINQIYEFNKIYWNRVRQLNLPVTINTPKFGQDIFILHPQQTTRPL